MQHSKEPSFQNWIVLIFLSIVWGSSFILMKKGLIAFSGVQVGSLRIAIAFLVFIPIALKHIRTIPKEKLKYILTVGLVGSFIPAYLFAIAETKLDSAPTGILNSLVPLFTFIWGIIAFKQQKNSKRFLGILIGLIGAITLIIDLKSKTGFNSYALLVVLATILYGLSSNVAKTFLNDVKPLQITSLGFFLLGIPAIAILLSTDFITVMQTHEQAWQSLGYVSILSIMGTALALILFWKLVQDTDAIFGSLTTYIIPIVAVAWGLLDGEQLLPYQYIGFALILVSVFLMKRK